MDTTNHLSKNQRKWVVYECSNCGGMVMTVSLKPQQSHFPPLPISQIWPQPQEVSDLIPERAREFLTQAIASIQAPAGAVMLTASSVDAMLKDKGYHEGNLFSRIDSAALANVITNEMAAWAHDIRLDANDQRHADTNSTLPTLDDAERVIEFAQALGQFLYVLPARVQRGRKAAKS